jgi:hypothetical protein
MVEPAIVLPRDAAAVWRGGDETRRRCDAAAERRGGREVRRRRGAAAERRGRLFGENLEKREGGPVCWSKLFGPRQ